ncbi:RNA 2',3'-cyclic phosphodiesterase [Phaeospirillum tilakii]|uniref:RNA 2',3'-cyclic phosphodiesterase n=1 Tax=Phaeospirillum tilakii TaxID=741673 RepID=A0ABW5C8Z8_9PROT
MIRLFVGLDLPGDLAERLAGLTAGLPGARRIEPENLHLTLRFVGEIDEATAADLDLALTRVEAAPFTLTLTELGLFGDRHRARTLWRGVEASPPLRRLAGRIEAAATRVGLAAETRRFTPHITLARLDSVRPERLQRALAVPPPPETLAVEAFTLFQSHLSPHGAQYERLVSYPLTAAGSVPGGLSGGGAFE